MTASNQASSSNRLSSPPWKALLLLAVVFLLGAGCGIGGSGLWIRAKMKAAISDPHNADGAFLRRIDRVEARLIRDLDLTTEEQRVVAQEFERAAEQFKTNRVEYLNSLQAFSTETKSRIEQSLPPEKREAFRISIQKGAFW